MARVSRFFAVFAMLCVCGAADNASCYGRYTFGMHTNSFSRGYGYHMLSDYRDWYASRNYFEFSVDMTRYLENSKLWKVAKFVSKVAFVSALLATGTIHAESIAVFLYKSPSRVINFLTVFPGQLGRFLGNDFPKLVVEFLKNTYFHFGYTIYY